MELGNPPNRAKFRFMPSLETDIEVGADGSLRLLGPRPAWLKPGRLHVLLSVADTRSGSAKSLPPPATPEMIAERKAALERLRAAGGLTDVIPDPAAWQQEIRTDVVLPARD
jgi:hypothetical protein